MSNLHRFWIKVKLESPETATKEEKPASISYFLPSWSRVSSVTATKTILWSKLHISNTLWGPLSPKMALIVGRETQCSHWHLNMVNWIIIQIKCTINETWVNEGGLNVDKQDSPPPNCLESGARHHIQCHSVPADPGPLGFLLGKTSSVAALLTATDSWLPGLTYLGNIYGAFAMDWVLGRALGLLLWMCTCVLELVDRG